MKFFERQKLVRIIRRLQRTLAIDGEENEERKHAKRDLEDARIMLNYVLNFPYVCNLSPLTLETPRNTSPSSLPQLIAKRPTFTRSA